MAQGITNDFFQWVTRCRAILEGNQKRHGHLRYTRPAPHVYEYQWLWDSCFHAISYRWFDIEMAKDELLSVVARQIEEGPDAGLIPHMNYWKPDGEALWGVPERSIITQPPLIAVAAEKVFEKSADIEFLKKLYPHLVEVHRWFDRRRDPDNDHLVSIIHPWEAGCDASPRWDGPLGLTRPNPEESKKKRHQLVDQLRTFDCNIEKLDNNGWFNVEPLDMNGIRAADVRALGRIAALLGRPAEATAWEQKWAAIGESVRGKMAQGNRYFDLNSSTETPIQEESAAQFLLLFGECVDEKGAGHLVEALQSDRFTTPYLVPTSPTTSSRFDPTAYWRGNVWLSINWLIVEGLKKYGYMGEARAIQINSLKLVDNHGFYEYFNPLTGEGYGPDKQSWSTIVLDFAADLGF